MRTILISSILLALVIGVAGIAEAKCRCMCVDGEEVNVCDDWYDVPKVCWKSCWTP